MKEYNVPCVSSRISLKPILCLCRPICHKNHICFPSSDIERDPIAGNLTIVPRPSKTISHVLWSDPGTKAVSETQSCEAMLGGITGLPTQTLRA